MTIRRLIILGRKSFEGYSRDNCAQMAAAIAYHILFAIVPLVMFIVAAIGIFIGTDNVQQRITDYLSENLDLSTADVGFELTEAGSLRLSDEYGPAAVITIENELEDLSSNPERTDESAAVATDLLENGSATVAGYEVDRDDVDIHFNNAVLDAIRSVVNASGTLSVISVLALAFAASGLFGQVRRSLDYVWGQPRRRPLVQGKIMDVALLLVLLVLSLITMVAFLIISIASQIILRIASQLAGEAVFIEGTLGTIVSIGIPLLFTFALFTLLYRFGPRAQVRLGDVLLGAFLAAAAFEVLKYGYGVYVRNFGSFDVVYGALGGVLLFLLFVFFSAQVFLFGAEIAVTYPRVVAGQYDKVDSSDERLTLTERAKGAVRNLFFTPPDDKS